MKFLFRKFPSFFISICILFSIVIAIPIAGFAKEAPAESIAVASPAADGADEVPSPTEESMSPPATELTVETSPSESQGEEPSLTPLAEIIEIARFNGEKAAVLIDTYENVEEYEAGIRDIQSLYYTENLDEQRKAFETSLHGKAIDIVNAFHAAAQERLSAKELDYIPGEVLVVYNNDVTEEQAGEVVAEYDGNYLETIDTPSEESVGIVEISLEQLVIVR